MKRLEWTPRALNNLIRLRRFRATKNADAARRAVATIRAGVKTLVAFPEIGRLVPHLGPEFREWPIEFGDGSAIVGDRITRNKILLLAIRHSRELDF